MSDSFNPPRLSPVVPILGQRGKFVPTVGRKMPVQLHGELVMTEVMEVVSRDVAVVVITGMVMGKTGHGLHTKDTLAVQRSVSDLGIEEWTPISEREVTMRETAARLAHAEADRRAAEALPAPQPKIEISVGHLLNEPVELPPENPPARKRKRKT